MSVNGLYFERDRRFQHNPFSIKKTSVKVVCERSLGRKGARTCPWMHTCLSTCVSGTGFRVQTRGFWVLVTKGTQSTRKDRVDINFEKTSSDLSHTGVELFRTLQ